MVSTTPIHGRGLLTGSTVAFDRAAAWVWGKGHMLGHPRMDVAALGRVHRVLFCSWDYGCGEVEVDGSFVLPTFAY